MSSFNIVDEKTPAKEPEVQPPTANIATKSPEKISMGDVLRELSKKSKKGVGICIEGDCETQADAYEEEKRFREQVLEELENAGLIRVKRTCKRRRIPRAIKALMNGVLSGCENVLASTKGIHNADLRRYMLVDKASNFFEIFSGFINYLPSDAMNGSQKSRMITVFNELRNEWNGLREFLQGQLERPKVVLHGNPNDCCARGKAKVVQAARHGCDDDSDSDC